MRARLNGVRPALEGLVRTLTRDAPHVRGQQALRWLDDASRVARREPAGAAWIAAFDLDGTMFHGEMLPGFARMMAGERRFGAQAGSLFERALTEVGVSAALVRNLDANQKALLVVERVSDTPGVGMISQTSFFRLMEQALIGHPRQELVGVASRLMTEGAEGVAPWMSRVQADRAAGVSMIDLVAAARQRGMQPASVTLAFDWLAEAAAPLIGIEARNVHASTSVLRAGVLTGATHVQLDKAMTLREIYGDRLLVAFGDSAGDASMLAAARVRGFAVNPKAGLVEGVRRLHGKVAVLDLDATVGVQALNRPR